ncbi:unknown protein [Waddlia chondrophila 2032/99]|uniref:Uncharacterized protein n=1 Tax=Waddlia chondrophila 2032/99 TaxID=765953 RepID=F8LBF4_9BACT|nr:unknown protein [Waddlia chondrophila 2032/99]
MLNREIRKKILELLHFENLLFQLFWGVFTKLYPYSKKSNMKKC